MIDSVKSFLPGCHNNDAGTFDKAMAALQKLTALDLGILMLNWSRSVPGQRAATGLPALADILIELRGMKSAAAGDRRRCLHGRSRFSQTPRKLVIELAADGTDYLVHGAVSETAFVGRWLVLRELLEQAPGRLTRGEIRRRWPGRPPPGDMTLYRWLERAVAQGLLCRDGRGNKYYPFRYGLDRGEEAGVSSRDTCSSGRERRT